MSVDAFSALPLQAGQAVAAAAVRTAKWTVAAYMRAPLRNTAIAALTTFSAMAGSNALYNQSAVHPAPLFGTFERQVAQSKAAAPVMPVQRPAQLLAQPEPETTGSVSPAAIAEPVPVTPIGNEDVFEIQRKLTAFKLFDGKVDGLYGPRTARAIKAFEASAGLPQRGELTPAIVELIKSASITGEPVKLEAAPAAAAQPVPAAPVQKLELAATENPLPAPQPLEATTQPVEERVAALEPTVAETGISTLQMNSPPEQAVADEANAPTKRAVQTIAVRAPTATIPEAAPSAAQQPMIDVVRASTDPKVVGAVQRGLASLGFLHGQIDGVAGEATAKAIRNFEVYYNYNVTGRITPELVNLLVQNGAVI